MAVPNPHYNPEWRALRDRHHEARTRAGDEVRRLCEAGDIGSEAYKEAKAAWERHNAAWRATYRKQYPTVEEYAAWLFGTFPVDRGLGAGIPVPEPDLVSFRTVEEADAAWSRIEGWVADSADEMRGSLPIGQPEGLEAFTDPALPKLMRYWRHFLHGDLYPAGYAGELGVRTLVTVDEQADGWHICFMQDNGSLSGSVTNTIERLATAVYREACAIAEQRMPQGSGLSGWLARCLARGSPGEVLDPGRFHFYQHVPAAGGWRAPFDRMALRFEDGEYRNPQWHGYRVIPRVIQSARFNVARDASPPAGTRPFRLCPLMREI